MRRLAPVVVVVALLVGCSPSPAALDRLVYAVPLPDFVRWWHREQAAAHRVSVATVGHWLDTSPARLDSAAARGRPWDVSTDLCSASPNRGPVFDFRTPCIRHDFAWRNLRRLDRLLGGPPIDTQAARRRANAQFRRDLDVTCATRPVLQRVACGVLAAAYHRAVDAVSVASGP